MSELHQAIILPDGKPAAAEKTDKGSACETLITAAIFDLDLKGCKETKETLSFKENFSKPLHTFKTEREIRSEW